MSRFIAAVLVLFAASSCRGQTQAGPGSNSSQPLAADAQVHGWLGASCRDLDEEKEPEPFSKAQDLFVRQWPPNLGQLGPGARVKVGCLVTDVEKDGPAAKAGLKAGDIIWEIFDLEFAWWMKVTASTFAKAVKRADPGITFPVRIVPIENLKDFSSLEVLVPVMWRANGDRGEPVALPRCFSKAQSGNWIVSSEFTGPTYSRILPAAPIKTDRSVINAFLQGFDWCDKKPSQCSAPSATLRVPEFFFKDGPADGKTTEPVLYRISRKDTGETWTGPNPEKWLRLVDDGVEVTVTRVVGGKDQVSATVDFSGYAAALAVAGRQRSELVPMVLNKSCDIGHGRTVDSNSELLEIITDYKTGEKNKIHCTEIDRSWVDSSGRGQMECRIGLRDSSVDGKASEGPEGLGKYQNGSAIAITLPDIKIVCNAALGKMWFYPDGKLFGCHLKETIIIANEKGLSRCPERALVRDLSPSGKIGKCVGYW